MLGQRLVNLEKQSWLIRTLQQLGQRTPTRMHTLILPLYHRRTSMPTQTYTSFPSPCLSVHPSPSVSLSHSNTHTANLSVLSSDLANGNFSWYGFWHFRARVNLLIYLCSALFCPVFLCTDMTYHQFGHWANAGCFFFVFFCSNICRKDVLQRRIKTCNVEMMVCSFGSYSTFKVILISHWDE